MPRLISTAVSTAAGTLQSSGSRRKCLADAVLLDQTLAVSVQQRLQLVDLRLDFFAGAVQLGVEVRVDAAGQGRLRLRPVVPPQAPPPGRTLQFWTKAPGAAGPSSLGLVRTTDAGGAIELPLERLPDLRPEQLFEITLEPEGGSPIDRPTGPILYIGRAVQLEG